MDAIKYKILHINKNEQTVIIQTTFPGDKLKECGIFSPQFDIIVPIQINQSDQNSSEYLISFRHFPFHKDFPPLFPSWTEMYFVIPLWSLIARPSKDWNGIVSVNLDECLQSDAELLAPSGVGLSIDDAAPLCLISGFECTDILTGDRNISVHTPAGHPVQKEILQNILAAHYAAFDVWIWDTLHLLIEPQNPVLKKQKAMLFTVGRAFACARYVLQSLQPKDIFEQCTFIDIVEHEILHYYIDTSQGAGDWLVEGLTTYLSRKILLMAGIITEDDWEMFVLNAFDDMEKNPLSTTVPLCSIPDYFWEPQYGNVVYTKGFLAAYCLDLKTGGRLPEIAKKLFRSIVSKGTQFDKSDFVQLLSEPENKYLDFLLTQPDLTSEFKNMKILP